MLSQRSRHVKTDKLPNRQRLASFPSNPSGADRGPIHCDPREADLRVAEDDQPAGAEADSAARGRHVRHIRTS
jgi:hypothetical protein